MVYFSSVLAAIVIMGLGELLENETKIKYVSKGYNWNRVLIYSNLSAIIFGVLSVYIVNYAGIPSQWSPVSIPFSVTISAYITAQSFMTDLRVLLINRKILRVAYLSMYALSLYNVIFNDIYRHNTAALVVFTLLLVGIFIFSSIGASDVRAMAVSMPFVISLGGYDSIMLFIITLIIVATVVGIRNIIRDRHRMAKFKEDNIEVYKKMNRLLFYKFARDLIRKEKTPEEMATAVGPYMITPFLIYLIIFPLLVR